MNTISNTSVVIGSALFCVSTIALAIPSDAGVAQQLRPALQPLPETILPDDKAEPKLVLPSLDQKQSIQRLSSRLRVYVRQFSFEGNRVVSDAELTALTKEFTSRVITSTELQQLRNRIGRYYLERGYINSGAIIPDQKVAEDTVLIRIIEGKLTRIETAGNYYLDESYIADRLQAASGEPLQILGLEQELKLLQQSPSIKRLNAELRPGEQIGEAELYVQVEEDRPGRVDISLNNYRPPSIGAEQLEIDATWFSLTGQSDPLVLHYSRSEGLDDVYTSYQYPLNRYDTRLAGYAEYATTEVVEAPFDQLDIKSRAKTFGLSITHPFMRSEYGQLLLGVALEHRESQSSLLDIPFSFAPGVQDGVATVTPLRLSIDWFQRDSNSVLAARSVLSFGLDAMGATVNEGAADGRFVAWLGQLQWVRRFGARGYQFVSRISAQRTNDALLPLEKFVVGGYNTVRGYRENELVRDNGHVASVELHIPLFIGDSAISRWQLIPFADVGEAWEKNDFTPNPRSISSAGLALHWQPAQRWNANITWAHAFETINRGNRESDLQDDGVTFNLRYQLY